jgi:hypothetical protein
MVNIRSIAASSHPSRREQETKGVTTSHSRAGRTQREGSWDVTTTVVPTTPAAQRQCSATTVVMPSPVVAAEAMLVNAR